MSEMSKVEEVARAMKENLESDGSIYFRDDGGTCFVDGHVNMNALVKAAIQAMRVPTFEMKNATYMRDWEAEEVYQSMIDAALKE